MWRRIFFVSVLIVISIGIFWGTSRYPELNIKATSTGVFKASNLINYSQKYFTTPKDSLIVRIVYNWGNWINTNKKGMAFGVIFAALMISLLGFARIKEPKSKLGKVLTGVLFGSPLGVCVNCAAPIGYSLFKAGRSLETSLVTILSSPTLNIIVLSMSFTLFPTYLAVSRLVLVLLLLFIVVPILTRDASPNLENYNFEVDTADNNSFWEDLRITVVTVAKNFYFVIKQTVPLMIVAGLIGSFVMEVVPLDKFLAGDFSFIKVIIISLFSVILPAPMALDVFLANSFLMDGVPSSLVLPFTFALGSYSIYAFLIVKKFSSTKLAMKLLVSVFTMAVLSAYPIHLYEKHLHSSLLLTEANKINSEYIQKSITDLNSHKKVIIEKKSVPLEVIETDRFSIKSFEYLGRAEKSGKFKKLGHKDLGIDYIPEIDLKIFITPLKFASSVAAKDLNNDGLIDIVLTSGTQFLFYINQGNLKFSTKRLVTSALSSETILSFAMGDINNDGLVDIIYSSFNKGAHVILNESGTFDIDKKIKLPNNPDAFHSVTISLEDIDMDGDLDIFLGNYSLGAYSKKPSKESYDAILYNNFPNFKVRVINENIYPAETLASLFYDYDGDGDKDLWVGSEFDRSDYILENDGTGQLLVSTQLIYNIPFTATDTMGIFPGDIDNDGVDEIFQSQISSHMSKDFPPKKGFKELCNDVDEAFKENCKILVNASTFINIKSKLEYTKCNQFPIRHRLECINVLKLLESMQSRGKEVSNCQSINISEDTFFKDFCEKQEKIIIEEKTLNRSRSRYFTPRQANTFDNMLFINMNGRYINRSKQYNINLAGFTWNAKFKDYDNDGFLDLLAVNGYWGRTDFTDKVFYKNNNGKNFNIQTTEMGLTDYQIVYSYLSEDFDNDGDLDIFYQTESGGPTLFENKINTNQAISFELINEQKPGFFTGSSVFIHYGSGQSQRRNILLSGGFHSQDSNRVVFGLKDVSEIERITIKRSQEKITVNGPFWANRNYKLFFKN